MKCVRACGVFFMCWTHRIDLCLGCYGNFYDYKHVGTHQRIGCQNCCLGSMIVTKFVDADIKAGIQNMFYANGTYSIDSPQPSSIARSTTQEFLLYIVHWVSQSRSLVSILSNTLSIRPTHPIFDLIPIFLPLPSQLSEKFPACRQHAGRRLVDSFIWELKYQYRWRIGSSIFEKRKDRIYIYICISNKIVIANIGCTYVHSYIIAFQLFHSDVYGDVLRAAWAPAPTRHINVNNQIPSVQIMHWLLS